jgi:hypothetical protein
MRRILALAAIGLTLALGGCLTLQQENTIAAVAVISCNAADIAAATAVAITADLNNGNTPSGSQKDAAKAQAITADSCAAISKLPSVLAAATPAATK